jgi:hypothetical protein
MNLKIMREIWHEKGINFWLASKHDSIVGGSYCKRILHDQPIGIPIMIKIDFQVIVSNASRSTLVPVNTDFQNYSACIWAFVYYFPSYVGGFG